MTEKQETKVTTLLLAQNAIKAVKIHENYIAVYYADSNDPVIVSDDDELYGVHLANYRNIEEQIRKQAEEATKAKLEIVPE